MIALKKLNLVLAASILIGANAFAQDSRMDIGVLASTSEQARIGIEFRKPIGEQYKFKLGATFGSRYDFFGSYNNSEIIFVDDSLILERMHQRRYNQGGIRIGAERRFKTSMFSLGADLNINYLNQVKFKYNRATILDENGDWTSAGFATDQSFEIDPSMARISQHFVVPSLRISFNMDVPLGKSFLLNLQVASSMGAPIYMGASQVVDPYNEFLGSPAASFDFETHAGIGLRYLIGKVK